MEHFCNQHGTEFFKRGNMRGYAHPIGEKDESTGKYPEGWCNEDAQEVAKLPARTPQPIPLADGEEPVFKSKDKQIAEHVWWKELGNRIGDGSLEKDYPTYAVKIKHEYYKKMSEVIGVSFK